MQTSNKYTPMIVGAVAITTIIGVGGYIFLTDKNTGTESVSSGQSSNSRNGNNSQLATTTPTPDTNTGTISAYKNGTYTTSRSYAVPHGEQNSIKVTVTITDGNITDVMTTNDYNDKDSGYYIDSFEQNIKSAMVGTKISDAYAGRVGGASLTSSAFNDAIQTILKEVKA